MHEPGKREFRQLPSWTDFVLYWGGKREQQQQQPQQEEGEEEKEVGLELDIEVILLALNSRYLHLSIDFESIKKEG